MRQVYANTTSLRNAVRELQGFRQVIVSGAAAWTDITVPGIRQGDTIVSVANLTDLAMIDGAASKALSNFAGDLDTIIEAHTAGIAGNLISITVVGDSAAAAGVTIEVDGNFVVIHYESGVSTVGDVETAITALAGADDIIDVKTAGTGATVLTAPGDDVATVT
jgi:hypothetical protein